MKKAKIISGFPGVGKTYITSNNNSKLVILDSDSSKFSWLDVKNKIRHPDFPQNYIDHILDNIYSSDIIFVSSHDIVRNALKDNNIEYYLVYPDKSLKEEYIKRYKNRGTDENFISFVSNNWDAFIDEMDNETFANKIKLEKPSHTMENVIYSGKILSQLQKEAL